jgi:hypothetical protein
MGVLYASGSCLVVVLGMWFVRAAFRTSAARVLYDVLAVLIWLFIVLGNIDLFIRGLAHSGGDRGEGLRMTMMITALVALPCTMGAVLVVSVVATVLGRRGRERRP